MASRVFPYVGRSDGISKWDDTLTVASEEPATRISEILRKYQITGVLPHVGRAAMPADIYFGGDDFQSLTERVRDGKATLAELEKQESVNSEVVENANEHGGNDPSDGEHGVEGDLEGAKS